MNQKVFKILGWVATCTAMLMCYGVFQEKRDWPIIIANTPGIIFGALAAITAL